MLRNKLSIVLFLLFFFLVLFIYRPWLLISNIIGGDWPFLYQESVNTFSFLPPSWSGVHGNGLGGTIITYALDSYMYSIGWLFSGLLHIPWPIVSKIFWFGMFVIVSFFSSMYFFKSAIKNSVFWQKLLAAFIYTTNTYILMVAGGGQMGVALGYAFAPLVFARFIILRESLSKKNKRLILAKSIFAGIMLSVQVLFDFRMAYVTMCGVLLYLMLTVWRSKYKEMLYILFYVFVIPLGISILLHLFWLLPLLVFRQNPVASLNDTYTSVTALQYFSFATFSNAVGFLHPYWPENIFGKGGFMKPEYLVLPIFAFSSLLFVSNKTQKKTERYANEHIILFFALLGLIGVFLAKGANEPFGQIYIWAFEHIPGFIMFRDPTKWYLLIAVAYSVLMPFTIYSIYNWLISKIKTQKFIPSLFVILFIIFWLFTVRQAVFGQLGITFQQHQVPQDYTRLENILINDNSFSRTLWIPRQSRFAYATNMHPAIEAGPLLNASNAAEMLQRLQDKKTESLLDHYGIKYVIVPYDTLGEIFVKDRKYNPQQFEEYKKDLKKIQWLSKDNSFNQLAVFSTKQTQDHLSLTQKGKVTYTSNNSDQYHITINSPTKNILVFSEAYHPNWQLLINNNIIKPQKTPDGLMSFVVPQGKYHAELVFVQKYWYFAGFIISLVSLIVLLAIYFVLQYKDFFIYLKKTF